MRTVCVKYIFLKHLPMRHLPIASIRYDAWSIRYLIVVAYGYLSRENWDLIEAMGKCRLWVNVSWPWVNVPWLWVNVSWLMGKCRHGYMSHGYMSPNRSDKIFSLSPKFYETRATRHLPAWPKVHPILAPSTNCAFFNAKWTDHMSEMQ